MTGHWRFPAIRSKYFPAALFGITAVGLMLASGIHMGFIVLLERLEVGDFVKVNVPILYWMVLSAAVTALIVRLTRNIYEEPLLRLAQAARQVAGGDFSVYVPPVHPADKQDYMDGLIRDFNKMVAELGSIETLKTDFFSNVSHEIKTPLAVIQNSAALLDDGTLRLEQAEHAAAIGRYARRLGDLITDILKLNKLEKQNIQLNPEPYDLSAQLAGCALLFEDRWEEKDIDFEAELEDQAVVTADASLLELVWNNLLSNAVKFTAPGGRVTLRQTSGEGRVTVTVADTGCGMDENTIGHIFEKFYQGDTSHSTQGNGLGLALVRRILNLVGGEIAVASRPGEGSVFTVVLPAGGDENG